MDEVDFKTKPQVTLYVNNQPMIFLADSGADRTVVRDTHLAEAGPEKIRVLAANGQVKTSLISKPLYFQINQTLRE